MCAYTYVCVHEDYIHACVCVGVCMHARVLACCYLSFWGKGGGIVTCSPVFRVAAD